MSALVHCPACGHWSHVSDGCPVTECQCAKAVTCECGSALAHPTAEERRRVRRGVA